MKPDIAHIMKSSMPPEDGGESGKLDLDECAEEIMSAIHSKDVKGLVDALMDFFHEADKGPHEEGPPEEE